VEAGGVEPPSEKRYGSKTTCLSHSIGFAGSAWNAQDAQPTSPMFLARAPRTEVLWPAYSVTLLTEPPGCLPSTGRREPSRLTPARQGGLDYTHNLLDQVFTFISIRRG